jgi:ATP synthase protein I
MPAVADLKGAYLQAASLGLEIAVAVFLGAGLGYLADSQLKSSPWGMVIGLMIGAVAGLWNAYKFALKNERS